MKRIIPAEDRFIWLAGAVVFVFGILICSDTLIPNYVNRRDPNVYARVGCINNLRHIDGAKQQWAMETKAPSNATPTWENVKPFMGRGTGGSLLKCPQGGVYTLGNLRTLPTCSIKGHTLE